jgi:preprotein translocase SecE subunit
VARGGRHGRSRRRGADRGGLEGQREGRVLNWLTNGYKQAIDFLKEVQAELKRTTWPARKEVQGTTTVVIITVFIFAVFLWVVDVALSRGLDSILGIFKK